MTKTTVFSSLRRLLFSLCLLLFCGVAAFAHGTRDKSLISPAELSSGADSYKVIDLRSRQDYVIAHVPGSFLLPLQELSQKNLKKRGIAVEDPVVLYSGSESAAKKAKMVLEILGYVDIRILAGGFTHWLEDGQPTAAGNDVAAVELTGEEKMLPTLNVIPAKHDFGKIAQDAGIVSTTFTLKNTSSEEITVTEITTSCGCTTAEIESKTIPPGETRLLTVFFDPNFHQEPQGKFSRTVFLQATEDVEVQARIEVEIAE